MPKFFMKLVSTGTQAGNYDSRLLGGYAIDLLQKCHEIYQNFKVSSENIQQSRTRVLQMGENMDNLQATLTSFTDTVDALGVHMLQDNTTVWNRQQQIERTRREIASKKEAIDKLTHAHVDQLPLGDKEKRINELRHQRGKLEMQLSAINRDIDSAYEDVYTCGESLDQLKDMRGFRREQHESMLMVLKNKCDSSNQMKEKLLSMDQTDDVVNMTDMYVSPEDFRRMQYEIEQVKRKQILVEKHIEMQLSEREFLRETAQAIIQKVYDLEKKVRKENGDHGYESAFTQQPRWHQNLGGPGIWYLPSSSHGWNQLDRLNGETRLLATTGTQLSPYTAGDQEELIIVEDINNDEGTTV